jgi:hypothetical protein
MVQKPDQIVFCLKCGSSFTKEESEKVCSNCFACTGCEIFLCPVCGEEIVVKPIGEPRKRNILPNDIE